MLECTENQLVAEMPVHVESLKTRYEEENYAVYKDFITFFVSAVVGIRVFDKKKCVQSYGEFVSISDEAFAVLTIENNSSRWASMAADDEWRDCEVSSKWTTSREKRKNPIDGEAGKRDKENVANEGESQARSYRGWSAQGIARYNQLFQEIKAERSKKSFEDFEVYLMNEFQKEEEEEGKNKNKRQKYVNEMALPVAQHELWNDEGNKKLVEANTVASFRLPEGMESLGQTEAV